MAHSDYLKRAARKAAFARRRAAFAHAGPDQSAVLSDVLTGYRGQPAAGFMPINTEIDPIPAMVQHAAHARVGVPVIVARGQPLIFAQWHYDCDMVDGDFGAKIPAHIVPMVPHVIIVPLVAFDLCGGRLGYGGGFYDRTLEGLRKMHTIIAIGFAFDGQQADNLPLESTDQPLDMVVTDTRVIDITRKSRA